MEPVTIPLCEAILAFGRGERDRAVGTLLPLRYATRCVGGSFAQRDLFAQVLVERPRSAVDASSWPGPCSRSA